MLKTKAKILNWLESHDYQYEKNIKNNSYEFIDIHDKENKSLLNEWIKKNHLPSDYFDKLKTEGHQYIMNVKQNIGISFKYLTEIPIQFFHIDGDFDCSDNNLISLKGSPLYVGRNFYCCHNQLKSLEYCPQFIVHNFDCSKNLLTSLEYGPQIVGGHFVCDHNQLISLDHFPEIITKGVYLQNNEKLLKYKSQSNELSIQNMSDDEFLDIRDFKFWKQFHLMEKIKKENNQILDEIKIHDKIEIKPKMKKV